MGARGIESLYSDGSQSKLDRGPGLAKQQESDQLRRETQAHAGAAREQRMLDRNYRRAARRGDPEAERILQQRLNTPGYKSTSGVQDSQQLKENARENAQAWQVHGQRLAGGGQVNPGTAEDAREVARVADKAGAAPEPAAAPSAPGVSASPSAAQGVAETNDYDEEARIRSEDKIDDWQLPADRRKFSDDLARSESLLDGDSDAMGRAYERGRILGLDKEQIDKRMGQIGEERESAATAADAAQGKKAQQEAKDAFGKAYGSYLNSPEGKAATAAGDRATLDEAYDRLKGESGFATGDKEGMGFEVSQDAKDKTKWTSFEAKQRAAEKTGYEGEVSASTDFGQEALGKLPAAQNQLDALNALRADMGNSLDGKMAEPKSDRAADVAAVDIRSSLDPNPSAFFDSFESGYSQTTKPQPKNPVPSSRNLNVEFEGNVKTASVAERVAQQKQNRATSAAPVNAGFFEGSFMGDVINWLQDPSGDIRAYQQQQRSKARADSSARVNRVASNIGELDELLSRTNL